MNNLTEVTYRKVELKSGDFKIEDISNLRMIDSDRVIKVLDSIIADIDNIHRYQREIDKLPDGALYLRRSTLLILYILSHRTGTDTYYSDLLEKVIESFNNKDAAEFEALGVQALNRVLNIYLKYSEYKSSTALLDLYLLSFGAEAESIFPILNGGWLPILPEANNQLIFKMTNGLMSAASGEQTNKVATDIINEYIGGRLNESIPNLSD